MANTRKSSAAVSAAAGVVGPTPRAKKSAAPAAKKHKSAAAALTAVSTIKLMSYGYRPYFIIVVIDITSRVQLAIATITTSCNNQING